MNEYKSKYTFGMDFGTSDFKFGPITLGETPRLIHNRGYFPDTKSLMMKAFQKPPDVVVGDDVQSYLQSLEDVMNRLVYPMKNGVIEKTDAKAWEVVRALVSYALNSFRPRDEGFRGFYAVASLSAISPRYMYERMFEILREVDGGGLIKAATIIPQPFAVAIGHGVTTCVVIESGHGNTQVCPISRYPILNALVAVNRGGGDANAITAEILKDCGYGDLAYEESLVRRVKEEIGLVPSDLYRSVEAAKGSPHKFRARLKVPGTRLEIDLEDNSWMRFLIGEYAFDPNHEVFESFFKRGMPRPKDVKLGDIVFRGMIDMGEAIVMAVERCPTELQPLLYREVVLSGGNFSWKVPEGMDGVCVDAPAKIRLLLRKKGIRNVTVRMTKTPQYSVWHGCIIYGYAVPEDYKWSWDRLEGWMELHEQ